MLNIKKIFTFCFLLFVIKGYNQNKQVLYNFAELPQTLLLNPGAEINYKYHIGVPLLSGFSVGLGSKGFAVADLFLADNKPIIDKVSSVIDKSKVGDHGVFNFQVEILNGGFKYDDKTYFSFGFYEEVDGITYLPKDVITLITKGNSQYLNKSFDFSQILYKVDVLGVLHLGITKKVSEKLTLGARVKLFSSALNLESTSNSGTFTTVNGTNNRFTHYLSDVNVNLKTSGLIVEGDENINPNTVLSKTFLGANLGVGFDVGFTYHFSDQLELTGSIIDIGSIKYSKNINNNTVVGNYAFEGIEFSYNPNNVVDYWEELGTDFKAEVVTSNNEESYLSWRPTKINTSLKYSFAEQRSESCNETDYKKIYKHAIGVQLYSINRPFNTQLALTGFFEKSFSKKLQAKVTYTLDDYSLYNIGAGFSAQFGKVNFYGMVDNITQFNDIASANNISVQLGINLIFH